MPTLIPHDTLEPTEFDAVFGRGGSNNNRRKGSILRQNIERHWTVYTSISAHSSVDKKNFIMKHLIDPIVSQGGRFLRRGIKKQKEIPSRWYELDVEDKMDFKEIEKKLQQCLRDEKKANVSSILLSSVKKEKAGPAAPAFSARKFPYTPKKATAAKKAVKSSKQAASKKPNAEPKKEMSKMTKKVLPGRAAKKPVVNRVVTKKIDEKPLAVVVTPAAEDKKQKINPTPEEDEHPGKKILEDINNSNMLAKRNSNSGVSIVSLLSASEFVDATMDFMSESEDDDDDLLAFPVADHSTVLAPMQDIATAFRTMELDYEFEALIDFRANSTDNNAASRPTTMEEMLTWVKANAHELERTEMEQKVNAALDNLHEEFDYDCEPLDWNNINANWVIDEDDHLFI